MDKILSARGLAALAWINLFLLLWLRLLDVVPAGPGYAFTMLTFALVASFSTALSAERKDKPHAR